MNKLMIKMLALNRIQGFAMAKKLCIGLDLADVYSKPLHLCIPKKNVDWIVFRHFDKRPVGTHFVASLIYFELCWKYFFSFDINYFVSYSTCSWIKAGLYSYI